MSAYDYWQDVFKGMELEREINDWLNNQMPKGRWIGKKINGLTLACCSNCDYPNPHMPPLCDNCGAIMSQLIKNDKGKWEEKYPDYNYIIEFYKGVHREDILEEYLERRSKSERRKENEQDE